MERSQRIPLAVLAALLVLCLAALGKSYVDKRKLAEALRQQASAESAQPSDAPEAAPEFGLPQESAQPPAPAEQAPGMGPMARWRGAAGQGPGAGPPGRRSGGGQAAPGPEGGQAGGGPGGGMGGLAALAASPEAQQMVQGFMRSLQERRQRGEDIGPALQKAEEARQAFARGDLQQAASLFQQATQGAGQGRPLRGGANRPGPTGGQRRARPAGAPRQPGAAPRADWASFGFQRPGQAPAGGGQQAGGGGFGLQLGAGAPPQAQMAQWAGRVEQARETVENAKIAIRERNQDQLIEILDKALALLCTTPERPRPPAARMPAGPPAAQMPTPEMRPPVRDAEAFGEQVQSVVFDVFDKVRALPEDQYGERRAALCTGLLAQLLLVGRGAPAAGPQGADWFPAGRPAGPPASEPPTAPGQEEPVWDSRNLTPESVAALLAALEPMCALAADFGVDTNEIDTLVRDAREAIEAGRLDDAQRLLAEAAQLLGFPALAAWGPLAPWLPSVTAKEADRAET
jgi:hypothetical protein